MDSSSIFEIEKINEHLSHEYNHAIENGQVVFLPTEAFTLETHEQSLLNDKILAPKEKNISYQYHKKKYQA